MIEPLSFPRIEAGLDGLSAHMLKMHLRLYEKEVETFSRTPPLTGRVGEVFNAVAFHENYFSSLAQGGSDPTPDFVSLINRDFGGKDQLYSHFRNPTGFVADVPGWSCLVYSRRAYKLAVIEVRGHEEGWAVDLDLLFALDRWEHAYALDYGIMKDAYIEAVLLNVDWALVSGRVDWTRVQREAIANP